MSAFVVFAKRSWTTSTGVGDTLGEDLRSKSGDICSEGYV